VFAQAARMSERALASTTGVVDAVADPDALPSGAISSATPVVQAPASRASETRRVAEGRTLTRGPPAGTSGPGAET
jgi:hypothetical protein